MNNQLKSKAYMDGVACAVQFLCGIAEQYISIVYEAEDEDEAQVMMDSDQEYGRAVGALSRCMGIPFLTILPTFFTCMDQDVPKSIGRYMNKGDTELLYCFLLGFSFEVNDSMEEWDEFMLEHEYIEDAGEEVPEIEFDREKVQQIINEMERSGQE